MTYQSLCNLITQGGLNYYSVPFDIIVEPLSSTSQLSYRVTVIKNKTGVDHIDIEPQGGPWRDVVILRDKVVAAVSILRVKWNQND